MNTNKLTYPELKQTANRAKRLARDLDEARAKYEEARMRQKTAERELQTFRRKLNMHMDPTRYVIEPATNTIWDKQRNTRYKTATELYAVIFRDPIFLTACTRPERPSDLTQLK